MVPVSAEHKKKLVRPTYCNRKIYLEFVGRCRKEEIDVQDALEILMRRFTKEGQPVLNLPQV